MLEYGGMVGRLWRAEVFSKAGMIEDAMDEEYAELDAELEHRSSREVLAEQMSRCHAGTIMGRNSLLAAAAMRAYNRRRTRRIRSANPPPSRSARSGSHPGNEPQHARKHHAESRRIEGR